MLFTHKRQVKRTKSYIKYVYFEKKFNDDKKWNKFLYNFCCASHVEIKINWVESLMLNTWLSMDS